MFVGFPSVRIINIHFDLRFFGASLLRTSGCQRPFLGEDLKKISVLICTYPPDTGSYFAGAASSQEYI
jgi:hypothetical protein